jgi:transaldolase
MKLFLDSVDIDAIRRWAVTPLIDGITTNPTLMSKAGKEPKDLIVEICAAMGERDVSVEVTESDPRAVYEQALKIADLAENVVVKIPCCREYVSVIEKLVDEGITINTTLIFSAVQALMMAKLGVAYVSPFIGRLDDIDADGLHLINDIREIYDTYEYETEILAASIRSVRHISEVALRGADVATVPVPLFEKAFEHPLTQKGLDQFLSDWKALGKEKFP